MDYSERNATAGTESYWGRSLHQVSDVEEVPDPNPYQMVLYAILKTLHEYNTSPTVPMYGFRGTASSKETVFLLGGQPCDVTEEAGGWENIFNNYREGEPAVRD